MGWFHLLEHFLAVTDQNRDTMYCILFNLFMQKLDIATALSIAIWTSDLCHYINSDRALFSNLNPLDGGQSLYPMCTVVGSASVPMYCIEIFGAYSYFCSHLALCVVICLHLETILHSSICTLMYSKVSKQTIQYVV